MSHRIARNHYYIPQREERSERNGVHLAVFPFSMGLRNQNWTFKNTSEHRPCLKPRKPLLSGWMDRWVDGWMLIMLVLRFSSFSGMWTKTMRWFQIWPQKLSAATRSKVTSNSILKFWNFNADFRSAKWQKIMTVTNALCSRCKLRKVFKKNCL